MKPGINQRLSDPQRECLRLVANGLSSKEIAQRTNLSPQTVDQYLSKAANLLGATNRREAARRFLDLEDGPFRKSEFKTETVADSEILAKVGVSTGDGRWQRIRQMAGQIFPPIGGQRHTLTLNQNILAILRIAVVSGGGVALLVMVGYWLMRIFT